MYSIPKALDPSPSTTAHNPGLVSQRCDDSTLEGNSGRSKGQGHPQHTENSRLACATTLKTRSKRTGDKIRFKVLILQGGGHYMGRSMNTKYRTQ